MPSRDRPTPRPQQKPQPRGALRRPRSGPLLAALLSLVSYPGCSGQLDPQGANAGTNGESNNGIPGSETPGTSNPGGAQGEPMCDGVPLGSTAAPLRRLSAREYENTVRAVFPGLSLPNLEPIEDAALAGFSNDVQGQSATPLGVERYNTLARQVGAAAAADLSWAPCSDDSVECATAIAEHLGFQSYRRPLNDTELTGLRDFTTGAYSEFGFAETIELTVQALLESPYFLYRPEFGTSAAQGESLPLSDYEMASRLSYFFLETMPDPALFDAAASGALTQDAGLREQAERLLLDPRARPVLTGFLSEWLRLEQIEELSLDGERFPELDDALRGDLQESARLFLDHALWEEDSWSALVTGSYGFVNDRLAPLFGVDAPGSEELVYTELNPDERRGVLTQPALLASTSHGLGHSPIFRGVTMLTNVLCQPPAAPPPGVLDAAEPDEGGDGALCTTREQVEQSHSGQPACQGCHNAIDGAGFLFEQYDALGRYRTEENGCAVNATGALPGTDIDGELVGAIALSQSLTESRDAAECFTKNLFRFALGRTDTQEDACAIVALTDALNAANGSLQGLILHVVESPSFRSRPTL